jgi:glycosyltransferase involved in cell wall biosynthesis
MIDYSVIIPAYNEETFLPDTLDALKQAMSAVELKGEVIVVNNNSTDNTEWVARQHGVDVIFEKVNQISRARNVGAKNSQGHFLIFLDADTLITPELLQQALNNLKNKNCCGGGSTVDPDKNLKPFYQKGLDLWNWISVRFKFSAGSFIYCLREGFEEVGGFSEKVYASEEIWFSMSYKRWGKLKGMTFNIIDQAPVITSTRKFDWFSTPRIFLMLFLIVFFPFIMRNRSLCSLWYHRPKNIG